MPPFRAYFREGVLMSRTHKDKNEIYLAKSERREKRRQEPSLRRRFFNQKKSGPPLDGEHCPECGGFTDFQNGYLTCSECGWTDDVIETLELMHGEVA